LVLVLWTCKQFLGPSMRDDSPEAPDPGDGLPDPDRMRLPRRTLLGLLGGLGIGTAVFQKSLAAQAEQAGKVTPELIGQAEWVAGITLSEEERKTVAEAVERDQKKLVALRKVAVDYDVPPALAFYVAPPQASGGNIQRGDVQPIERASPERPTNDEELAFLPVTELAALIRARKVSSAELTKLYLSRLKRYDDLLKCVVTYTDDVAIAQAERADREIGAGRYRGPLHGIPWGAKDIIAWPGYKTTWGAGHFKDQTIDAKATVARRLEEAGAVLVAKLTVGALAMGDEWFGGMTRNPWNPDEGSSGSSAGSVATVAAGLVGFALGSETLGSIVSPCRRCSVTGLRPTFGRVSRHGCMTLSWSMDKIGPIARSVEDCAFIFGAIHGYDGLDPTAVDRPFFWPARREVQSLRVGYFEGERSLDERPEIGVLRELGVKLMPIKLPDKYPVGEMNVILDTEAATVFDVVTRQGVSEGIGRWATTFRKGEFVPAVEYLRANRVRTLLMREMEELMANVDAYVGGDDLTLTNLTGHPTVVIPAGDRRRSSTNQPGTITFTGKLFGETELLALAHAYQQATDAHLRRPPLEKLLAAKQKQSEPPAQ
jgi:Asp-tRNA(Asn)/Glu-tRNA(Gln) amidotransferase A subunit family amidase